ncbi:MAG: hypothetical protein H6Q74_1012 [Firmicutes bacterium]|nr:hypothetical protein [Bacillota bacterium]
MGDKSPKNKKKQMRRIAEKKDAPKNTQAAVLGKAEQ